MDNELITVEEYIIRKPCFSIRGRTEFMTLLTAYGGACYELGGLEMEHYKYKQQRNIYAAKDKCGSARRKIKSFVDEILKEAFERGGENV